MQPLRLLAAFLLFAVALPAAAQDHMYAPLPANQDMYSFADLYRVTTGAAELPLGDATASQPAEAVQIRTVSGEAPAAAPGSTHVFSISRVTPPQGGALFLAGLAAAVWVARRRLGYAIRG
jgi:hypothetical protein